MAKRNICGKDVEAIAKELGIKFVWIKNLNDRRAKDTFKRDPDTAYMVDTGESVTDFYGPHDFTLTWKHRNHSFKWKEVSLASIRKCLQDDGSAAECTVCFEELPLRESSNCAQCHSKYCTTCIIRMGLTEDGMRRIMSLDFLCEHPCCICREPLSWDPRLHYFKVLDRMQEFTPLQQETLVFCRKWDHNSALQIRVWEEKHPLKHFKPGVTVKLHGLKKQRKWNGKKAQIIGEGVVNNDTFRWPIQLLKKPRSKALLKQTNMIKLGKK